MAWEKNAPQVEVESDSEIVVKLLKKGVEPTSPYSSLGNKVVDAINSIAFSLELGVHVLYVEPPSARYIMLDDLSGVKFPRSVVIPLMKS
ncbi:hypothetical protein V2J09_015527 [Rumex salicifolius]